MTPPRDPNQLPVLDRATGLDDGYDCPECGRPADDCACDDEGENPLPVPDPCPTCDKPLASCTCPEDFDRDHGGLDGEYGCPECGFAGTCAGCDDYCPECNEAWAECECPIDEGELP